MTKTELIKNVALDAEISQVEARRILEIVETAIIKGLNCDGEVVFMELGKFVKKETAARVGHNPATGEKIQIPEGVKASFKASKKLKELIK